uniref:Gem nuclear organelle associated protein 2 n=3 Tax=Homininae TaxID=207598 RepID=A0A8J9FTZ9_HUMAN
MAWVPAESAVEELMPRLLPDRSSSMSRCCGSSN